MLHSWRKMLGRGSASCTGVESVSLSLASFHFALSGVHDETDCSVLRQREESCRL